MINNKELEKILDDYEIPSADEGRMKDLINRGQASIDKLQLNRTFLGTFIKTQLKYISKSVWLNQLLGTVFILLYLYPSQELGEIRIIIFKLIPLLSIFTVPELVKSLFYNMSEIEKTCKNSMSKLLTTRLLLVGILNILSIAIIVAFSSHKMGSPFIELIVYSLIPFNLINAINLLVVSYSKYRSFNNLIISSLIQIVTMDIFSQFAFFPRISKLIWYLAFVLSSFYLIYRIFHLLDELKEKEEEFRWIW